MANLMLALWSICHLHFIVDPDEHSRDSDP
jgi:hypothetical protein